MENEYQIVNIAMSLILKPGSIKYLIPSIEKHFKQKIENGMVFSEEEGIIYQCLCCN